MNFIIENDNLKVVISSFGAELQSIQTKDGKEWLWQGDTETWKDRSPNLFPYIGRLVNQKYQYNNTEYTMKIHGFVKYMELKVEKQAEDEITFMLESNEETKASYPFAFKLYIHYKLEGNRLMNLFEVENTDEKTMYFGIGGHPGFQVPFADADKFEDYYIAFEKHINPKRILFSKDCFVTGEKEEYILRDGLYMDLSQELFEDDAVVLTGAGHEVLLKSKNSDRAIKVEYKDMDYIGFWKMVNPKAAYVCIEPWSSLPARVDTIEDIALQDNLISLEAGKKYENKWYISVL